jgi:hypothetical protein
MKFERVLEEAKKASSHRPKIGAKKIKAIKPKRYTPHKVKKAKSKFTKTKSALPSGAHFSLASRGRIKKSFKRGVASKLVWRTKGTNKI